MEFLRTQGTIIVNEIGDEVLFKGFGMGNWLNQEGFLFGSSVFSTDFGEFVRAEKMDRGRSINQTIIELCGQEYAQNFWKQCEPSLYRLLTSRFKAKNLNHSIDFTPWQLVDYFLIFNI